MKKYYSYAKRPILKYKSCSQCEEEKNNEPQSGEDPFDFPDFEAVTYDNNRIYFYGEVEKNNVLTLNKTIHRISIGLQNRANELETDPGNIFLHINSHGGDLFDGLAASDYVKKSKVPIHSIIDGPCASAATFISVVATKRFMHENSFILIHQLSSQYWGNYAAIKDEMGNLDLLMDTIKEIYKKHTKIPAKKLEEILKRDVWLSSKDALKFGLVDGII